MNKKRKIITTSLAAVLAVALLAGGTITYLSDSSETVTNKFNTNEIDVDLDETTGDEYEIIPGTSEEKDPTITITSTVDSYLYVLVYGNNPTFTYTDEDGNKVTENIIDYAIAEGWEKLAYNNDSDSDGTNDNYTDETLAYFGVDLTGLTTTEITIYYREVEAGDEEQEFHVLENDVVSYSSEITDLSAYSDGDIYLAFAAYAIQQKPFSNAADALSQTVVDTTDGLTDAISNGEAVTLSGDISVSASSLASAIASGDEAVIDLNSNKLTVTDNTGTIQLSNGDSLTIANGEVVANNPTSTTRAAFNIGADSSITLENVTMTTDGCGIYPQGDAATVNIINSTITTSGAYCVSTNAATTDNYDVVINIENSVLTGSSDSGDNCPVLVNIPCELNITDSAITGDRQGVVVRAGTANITNTAITTTNSYNGSNRTTRQGQDESVTDLTKIWGSGNEVAIAALVVGNYSSTAYSNSATVTMSGVTLSVGEATESAGIKDAPQIFAASYSKDSYSSTTTLNISEAEGAYTVNSTTLTGSEGSITITYGYTAAD